MVVQHRSFGGGIAGLIKRLTAASKHRGLFVGIPQAEASRPGEEINNAELLYIHTHGIRHPEMRAEMAGPLQSMPYSQAYQLYVMAHGSPLWQSPPRPVIEPAIEKHKAEIAEQYAEAVKAAASGDAAELDRAITRTGELAVGYVRGWFTDPQNGWAPNSKDTVRRKGSDNPLIDTGTMRKAITWVVR